MSGQQSKTYHGQFTASVEKHWGNHVFLKMTLSGNMGSTKAFCAQLTPMPALDGGESDIYMLLMPAAFLEEALKSLE